MLYEKLKAYSDSGVYPFHMPGHKRTPTDGLPYEIDVTEIDGFDNLHEPVGCLCELQETAAKLFCSRYAFALVNGSTVGILSAVRAMTKYGDRVLIGGNYKEGDTEGYRIGVYDYDGKELAMSDWEDPVGYTALYETDRGIISANVSRLYLHDSDCKPLATVKDLKAESGFDSKTVSTFWVKDFSDDGNGALYMLVYAIKTDDTKEALLYKVTGF